jgi:hypothetical protein
MARYNEILVGRYNRMLQKLFGTKGDPPSPQLAGDIQPSFGLFSGNEHRYLEAWQRYVGVIEKLAVAVSVADTLFLVKLSAQAADLTNVIGGAVRFDARGTQASTLITSRDNNAGSGLGTIALPVLVAGAAPYDLVLDDNQELTLLPGDAVTMTTTAVNSVINVTAWWRERSLEESERT